VALADKGEKAMTEELFARIDQLNDSDVIEAAGYYLADVIDVSSGSEVEEKLDQYAEKTGLDTATAESIRNELVQDRTGHIELLRFLLRAGAAGSDEEQQRIAAAIDGVGQKQVVTETFLIVSMAIVAVALLIEKTGGKTKETTEKVIEDLPDGTKRITYRHEIVYADAASALGKLFEWFGKLPLN
jgi:hypothetical protein